MGDTEGVAIALENIGLAELQLQDFDGASAHFAESLRVCGQAGHVAMSAYCLEGLAAVRAAAGDPANAARLLGAAEQLLGEIGARLEALELALHERTVAALEEQLKPEELAAAWKRGQAFSLDEAVELALSAPREPLA